MNIREFLNTQKSFFKVSSDEELAIKIGTTKDNINKWIQRNNIPDKWQLVIGQMSKEDNSIKSELVTINFYEDIQASAGYGTANDDIVPIKMRFDKNFLRNFLNITRFDNLDIIRVIGDSMLPTIKDGEYIIVERCSDARNGDTIIANIEGELYVKRLYKIPLEKWVRLESENSNYPSIELNTPEKLEALKIVGVVKSKIKLY